MGRKCSVLKCTANYDALLCKGEAATSTFKFPDNELLRERWIVALNRGENWRPGNSASVCINHFKPEDILRYEKPARLKPDAVPSVFEEIEEEQEIVFRYERPSRKFTKETVLQETMKVDENTHEEEYIDPEEDLMGNLIQDFENFSRLLPDKINTDEWHYHQSGNVLHFYNFFEEDVDCAIRIENSIKVYNDMTIKLFLRDIKQTEDNLKWILDCDMRLKRWSQFETILQTYDSKVRLLREAVKQQSQSKKRSRVTGQEEILDYIDLSEEPVVKSDDSDAKMFEIDDHPEADNCVESEPNLPARSNNKRLRTTQQRRAEQKLVREIIRKFKNSPHKCYICDQDNDTSKTLQHHLVEHADMLPFNCDRCITDRVIIRNVSSLNKHLRMHQKPLKCRACDCRYIHYRTRLEHEQNSHEQCGPLTCEDCGAVYDSLPAFEEHIKLHANLEAVTCKTCGKLLSSRNQLELHMRIHTEENPVTCPSCPTTFDCISKLADHQHRLHGTKQPFRCTFCEQTFPSSAELNQHLSTHESTSQIIAEQNTTSQQDSEDEEPIKTETIFH